MPVDSLALNLVITHADGEYPVPGAHIKRFALRASFWGFEAEAEFIVEGRSGSPDVLLPSFVKPDLMSAVLKVVGETLDESRENAAPLVLQGIVKEKRVFEQPTTGLGDSPVEVRRYTIVFADPAAVLWKQHFPCDLFVEKTMQDVLDAHKGEKITIAGEEWDALTTAHPIHFIGLGDPDNQASFYDFLVWYVHARNGIIRYNCITNDYVLRADKGDPGDAVSLDGRDIARVEVALAEIPRHSASVLNSYIEDASKKDVANDAGVTGIRRDILLRTTKTSDADARKTLEEARLKAPEPAAVVTFGRFPRTTIYPWAVVGFINETWPSSAWVKNKIFRAREVRIRGTAAAAGDQADHGMAFSRYEIEGSATLESTDDLVASYPPFVAPKYPVRVEGKMVSSLGEETDETYEFDAEKIEYKIEIPLFPGDDGGMKVPVRREPDYLTGHFYFPVVKAQRVLLAFELQKAIIERFLDWNKAAELPPMDSQGNHLVLGKAIANRTLVSHLYEDDKPVLSIHRTMEKDTELVKISEGDIFIEVKEES